MSKGIIYPASLKSGLIKSSITQDAAGGGGLSVLTRIYKIKNKFELISVSYKIPTPSLSLYVKVPCFKLQNLRKKSKKNIHCDTVPQLPQHNKNNWPVNPIDLNPTTSQETVKRWIKLELPF